MWSKALHSAFSRRAAEVAPDPEEEEQHQEPEGRPEHKFVYRLLKKPEIGRDLVGQKVGAALSIWGRAWEVSPSVWVTPWPGATPVLGPSSWVASCPAFAQHCAAC